MRDKQKSAVHTTVEKCMDSVKQLPVSQPPYRIFQYPWSLQRTCPLRPDIMQEKSQRRYWTERKQWHWS